MYRSTKTYGHEIGLSCCFRQWRADSHCRHLHGYAISVRLEFEATELDHNNWVVDFGGLKEVRKWLEAQFDHTLLVAQDDPERDRFLDLMRIGIARVVVLPKVGCEAFAKIIADYVEQWAFATYLVPGMDFARVRLASVEVREHGANSAIYIVPPNSDVVDHSDARQAASAFDKE
jgi:6-pyruvoyltetrahydropterin/6-carboxytetrahydropterin synthase